MTQNTLELRELSTTTSRGRGGERKHRHHNLLVNGEVVRTFVENSQQDNYPVGASYDRLIESNIERFEKALGCKVERTSRAHWTPELKARLFDLLHGDLEEVEWSGSRHGPGDGPMGSGPGPAYPACPVCGGMRERPMTEEEVERAHNTAANLPPARSFADGTETGWVDEYGRECG